MADLDDLDFSIFEDESAAEEAMKRQLRAALTAPSPGHSEDSEGHPEVSEDEVEARASRVVLAFIGPVSAGKSSLIRALFGFRPGNISPIEGSTDRLKFFEHPKVSNLFIVDTPGLADVVAARSQATLEALRKIDVAVFVLDRTDAHAKSDYRTVTDQWRIPACVVRNKIDLVHPEHRAALLSQLREHFGIDNPRDVMGVCAGGEPPDTPEVIEAFGLDDLIDWIFGQDLSAAQTRRAVRGLKDRDAAARQITWLYVAKAAALGAIPVPGLDIAPLMRLHKSMIREIAALYGRDHLVDSIVNDFVAGIVGNVVRLGFRLLLHAGKAIAAGAGAATAGTTLAVSAAAGALIAGATTFALGMAAAEASRRNLWDEIENNKELIKELSSLARDAYKRFKDERKRRQQMGS